MLQEDELFLLWLLKPQAHCPTYIPQFEKHAFYNIRPCSCTTLRCIMSKWASNTFGWPTSLISNTPLGLSYTALVTHSFILAQWGHPFTFGLIKQFSSNIISQIARGSGSKPSVVSFTVKGQERGSSKPEILSGVESSYLAEHLLN